MGEDRKKKNQRDTNKNSFENNNNFYFNFGCEDIFGGFQHIYPEAFVVTAEILGDVIAGKLPFNVQNALGNWFELMGQVILTYNAQQQYFQGGPGRYFNPAYYNVSNPFCDSGTTTESNSSSGSYNDLGEENAMKKDEKNIFWNSSSDKKNNDYQINELREEIEKLKEELQNIKENMKL